MSTKSHLIISSEPLSEGKTQLALCGAVIPDSVFTLRWIAGKPEDAWGNTILFCSKCIAKFILEREKQHVYVTGAVEGGKIKRRTGEDAA